jgi:hypothetical protein
MTNTKQKEQIKKVFKLSLYSLCFVSSSYLIYVKQIPVNWQVISACLSLIRVLDLIVGE